MLIVWATAGQHLQFILLDPVELPEKRQREGVAMIREVSPSTFQGTDIANLDYILTERFNPGDTVDLRLAIDRLLSTEELAVIKNHLASYGLMVRRVGMVEPGVVSIVFDRPSRPQGYAQLPLSVLIIGALGAVGVVAVLGWSIASGVKSILQSIGKNVIWIGLIIGAVVILRKVATKR